MGNKESTENLGELEPSISTYDLPKQRLTKQIPALSISAPETSRSTDGSDTLSSRSDSSSFLSPRGHSTSLSPVRNSRSRHTISTMNRSNSLSPRCLQEDADSRRGRIRTSIAQSPTRQSDVIFCLQLEEGKYFIGKTRNIENTLKMYITEGGNEWTKMYRMIKLLETHTYNDEFDEDLYTKRYMKKYGIDNVRGGTYSSPELQKYQIKALRMELKIT